MEGGTAYLPRTELINGVSRTLDGTSKNHNGSSESPISRAASPFGPGSGVITETGVNAPTLDSNPKPGNFV